MAVAPDPNCGIISGSAAKLFICTDPDPVAAASLTWTEVMDLDNHTVTNDSTDTNVNTQGWIRTLPMERGMTITSTGRLNSGDPGQNAVDATALYIGCDALEFYRFLLPGPRTGDEPFADWGFWAWANRQDVAAASTDPFSWGVELRLWASPINLEDGQPVAASPGSAQAQAKSARARQTAGASAGAGGGGGATASEAA
jgi:hypothetical protein